MNNLIQKLSNNPNGTLLYGFTPPKRRNPDDKIRRISQRRLERLSGVNIDGLVIYDIQDESGRTDEDRPFPFLPTVDPIEYYREFLPGLAVPPVVYQCVGKYSGDDLAERIGSLSGECTVFVGSSSRNEKGKTSLREAYRMYGELSSTGPTVSSGEGRMAPFLGGVTIPERHTVKGDEHLRLIKKQAAGVGYFISQFVFNSGTIKNMLSDYHYTCLEQNIPKVPLIFTVTPVGSLETIELLKWLGVSIPRWIENDLKHSRDTLAESLDYCVHLMDEVIHFCLAKEIPFGCNVESVSIKRDEVLASFELVNRVEQLFRSVGVR